MRGLTYEAPEIFEIGEADKITLGCKGNPRDDCNCAKCRFDDTGCDTVLT